nr:LytTR family DNA-binding domain-containing protein [Fusicatenibacter faecihominis]
MVRLLEKTLKTGDRNRVAVKTGRQFRYPYTDDILYIDSNRHIVTLHLKDGSEIVTQDKLNDIESRIGEKRFLRCHQSYLVNMDQVADVKEDFILKNGNMVPIRVRGRKELIDAYNRYFLSRKEGDFAE